MNHSKFVVDILFYGCNICVEINKGRNGDELTPSEIEKGRKTTEKKNNVNFMSNLKIFVTIYLRHQKLFQQSEWEKKEFMKGARKKRRLWDSLLHCYVYTWKRCQEFKREEERKKKKHPQIYRSNESKKRIQRMIRFQQKMTKKKYMIPNKSDLSAWKLDYKIQTFFILV